MEQPYGNDDMPLSGIGPLPRDYLLEVAYQGSGLLESGDVLEFEQEKAPVLPGHVPFRFSITPATECGGYPKAGNGTCAVPDQTGAVALRAEERLVPVGSTVFIVELDLKLRINDTGTDVEPNQIDIYTGYTNNLNYYRTGLTVWLLTM